MTILVDKPVDLPLLLAEIQAVGVEIDGLEIAGDRLVTHDDEGHTIDLDDARIPPVLVAHVPPPPPPSPDYGEDASRTEQIADGVAQLRAYLALSSPTAAQTVGALRLVIRGMLFLLRRSA